MPDNARDMTTCKRIMIGSGTDTYDPTCELPKGHDGACRSRSAIDQHRLQWPAICWLCGREGTRGFILSKTGHWLCRSSAACERRIRGTGWTGVGTMRNYAR